MNMIRNNCQVSTFNFEYLVAYVIYMTVTFGTIDGKFYQERQKIFKPTILIIEETFRQ